MEPEVHVRSIRRRRSDPLPHPIPPPVNVRSWLVYTGLTTLVAALMVEGLLRHRPPLPVLPSLSYATEVQSAISEVADSLQIVVSWDLTLSTPAGRPDSIRIRVTPDPPHQTVAAAQPPSQLADTLYLSVPARGQTLRGISCAAAEHAGESPVESCTPWQYVRPSATPDNSLNRIVIKPGGLQVDPDIGGRCAEWQRTHPDRSVWVAVNRTAVPDCMGPNRKPTVAQFCAFAVLPDGKRVKTANSANNSYCEELFVEWNRELSS
jgi:hypothetical protein